MEFIIAVIFLTGAAGFLFSKQITGFFKNTPNKFAANFLGSPPVVKSSQQSNPQTTALKITNVIIFLLEIIGSLVIIYFGVYENEVDVLIIALGLAALLISTLVFQVINVFVLHVERSHQN